MGRDEDNLQGIPWDLGDTALALIESATEIGGAVLLFDNTDTARWINHQQRRLMPVPSYLGLSYSQLFWELHRIGRLGHASAKINPTAWLENALVERSTSDFTQRVNTYEGIGRVAMSNRRLANGWTIQIRHPLSDDFTHLPELALAYEVQASHEAASLRAALERMNGGVAILGAGGQMLYANGAFHEIVSSGSGLVTVSGNAVMPANPANAISWNRCFADALAGGEARALLRARDGKVALAATIFAGMNPGTVVVLAASLRQHLSRSAAEWLQDLGVTESEIDIVGLLIAGNSTAAIASRRQRSRGTVQAQITQARAALRQRDLPVDGPGQMIAAVLQMSAITRAPRGQ